MDHMTAVRMQLVRTLWAPIHVHAMMVSMAMVVYALTSMSAALEVISVMLTPPVLTSLVLTAASAEKATPAMEDIATTLMNAEMEQTDVAGTLVALTHRALTLVAVMQVSMVMGCHVVI